MITFFIPYFGSYLQGKGEVISKEGAYTRVKVLHGFCAGTTTDVSNLYLKNPHAK